MNPFDATVQIVIAAVESDKTAVLKGNGTEIGQFAKEIYDALKTLYNDEQSNRES